MASTTNHLQQRARILIHSELAAKLGTTVARRHVNERRQKGLIAAWLIFGRSFEDEELIPEATTFAEASVDHRRLMAAVAGNVLSWTDQVARAEDILRKGFVDEDHQVRTQAADVFRHLKPDDVERHLSLIEVFLRSRAFSEHGYDVLHLMGEATCNVLDLIILAAETTIADIETNGDRGSRRGMDIDRIQDLPKAEYNLSERNVASRKRILDLIDSMLAAGLSGFCSHRT